MATRNSRRLRDLTSEVVKSGSTTQTEAEAPRETDLGLPAAILPGRMENVDKAWQTDYVARKIIPPEQCRIWSGNHRLYERLDEDFCEDLIESFKAIGQQEPAVVREAPEGSGYLYEVVSGARRHWTATYLKRPLLVEIRELDDEMAFLLEDADNKDRKDLSPYERGLKYEEALLLHYKGKQRILAERVGRSQAFISGVLSVLDVARAADGAIVRAFGDPRLITVNHGMAIRPLLKDESKCDAVVAAAEAMAAEREKGAEFDSGVVLRKLLAAARGPKAAPPERRVITAPSGRAGMEFSVQARKVDIKIHRGVGMSLDQVLEEIRTQLEHEPL